MKISKIIVPGETIIYQPRRYHPDFPKTCGLKHYADY